MADLTLTYLGPAVAYTWNDFTDSVTTSSGIDA
jgi:hypothetical protein